MKVRAVLVRPICYFNFLTSTPTNMNIDRSSRTGKHCIVFSSTAVAMGSCLCVVTATGMSTEIGKVQSAVKAAAEDEEKTPLQQKLDDFGDLLAKVIFVPTIATSIALFDFLGIHCLMMLMSCF